MNDSFIKLHREIIQLKLELQKRSFKRLELENHDAIESKVVGRAVNDVLSYKMYWSVKRFLLYSRNLFT
jgi:hypothetical protein